MRWLKGKQKLRGAKKLGNYRAPKVDRYISYQLPIPNSHFPTTKRRQMKLKKRHGQARDGPPPGSVSEASQGRRRVPVRQPKKRRRAKNRTLHYLILLLFALGGGITLLLTVLLEVDEILVTGAGRYHPDEIIAVSGIEQGENLLRLSAGRAEEELLAAFPYLSAVRVRRRPPSTVEIVLTHHQPQAALLYRDGLAFIILEGKILERGAQDAPDGLPLVRGLILEDRQPGEILGGREDPGNEERLIMLRLLLEAAQSTGFPPITDVDLRDRLNIRVIHEDRLLLELGSEADLEYKLTFLNHIIQNEVSPTAQASLDASGARNRRIVRRDGVMISGEFIPDEILTPHAFTQQEVEDDEEDAEDAE